MTYMAVASWRKSIANKLFTEGWGICVNHKMVQILFMSNWLVQHSSVFMTHWLDRLLQRKSCHLSWRSLYSSDNRPPPVQAVCWSQLKLNGIRIGALEITISCCNVKLLCWADPHVLQKNPSLDLSAGMACEHSKCSGWRIIAVLVKQWTAFRK